MGLFRLIMAIMYGVIGLAAGSALGAILTYFFDLEPWWIIPVLFGVGGVGVSMVITGIQR